MTTIKKEKTVPFRVTQMYDLVNDINRYPEFLPWCSRAKVLEQKVDEVTAELTLSKGGIEKSFVTKNRLKSDESIVVELVSGPFKRLDGCWQFQTTNEGDCLVLLELSFEFSNALIGMAFGPLFNQIANTLVEAFCQRAYQLYGS